MIEEVGGGDKPFWAQTLAGVEAVRVGRAGMRGWSLVKLILFFFFVREGCRPNNMWRALAVRHTKTRLNHPGWVSHVFPRVTLANRPLCVTKLYFIRPSP